MAASDIIAAIDAKILIAVTQGYVEYNIAGRGKRKYTLDELRRMRREFATLAAREDNNGNIVERHVIPWDDC